MEEYKKCQILCELEKVASIDEEIISPLVDLFLETKNHKFLNLVFMYLDLNLDSIVKYCVHYISSGEDKVTYLTVNSGLLKLYLDSKNISYEMDQYEDTYIGGYVNRVSVDHDSIIQFSIFLQNWQEDEGEEKISYWNSKCELVDLEDQ